MLLVGIDPSLKATGVVVSLVHGCDIEVLGTSCVSHDMPKRDAGQGLRQANVLLAAENVIDYVSGFCGKDIGRRIIAIEDFAYGKTSSVSYDLGMFGGILRQYFVNHGFEVYLVPVAGSKAFISGRRVTSKEGKAEAVEFANEWGVLDGVKGKFRQEAVADAWAALCTFLRSINDDFCTERRKATVERLALNV